MEMRPVIGALDVDPPHALDALPLFVLIQVMGAACCPTRGLQQGVVGASAILRLVEQNIQRLFIYASFGELHLDAQNRQRLGEVRHTLLAGVNFSPALTFSLPLHALGMAVL